MFKTPAVMNTQYCEECGAGPVDSVSAPGKGMKIRLPHNFPYDQPCEACKKRDAERMQNLGRKFAMKREAAILKLILGE